MVVPLVLGARDVFGCESGRFGCWKMRRECTGRDSSERMDMLKHHRLEMMRHN